MNRKSRLLLVSVAAVAVGCSAGSANSPSVVGSTGTGGGTGGGSPGIGGTFIASSDAGFTRSLAAHIEQNHLNVSVVTLACAGGCADVVAVATGGYEPYTFAWDDGSTSATRHVCPTATTAYEVSVTDTGAISGEFPRPPETVKVPLTADVLTCPPDGGPPEDAGPVHVAHIDAGACDLGENLTPDIKDQPTYFSGGATLPAGKYRITYVDGCMKYDATWFWTVNANFNDEFVLIGASTATVLGTLPGTSAPFGFGVGGYADFDACVAANRALAPLDFDFAGGKLGIWQNDFKPDDNLGGPNGDDPTWRLTRLDSCP